MYAEEKGFEPLIPFNGYTAFRMRRNQPGYATPPLQSLKKTVYIIIFLIFRFPLYQDNPIFLQVNLLSLVR